ADGACARDARGTAVFDSALDETLYQLVTCTPLNDPQYVPDLQYARGLLARGQIAFWDNWKGLVLHDGAVFLGARPTPFTLRGLPHNVESDYLHLYLLTFYQKIRLSMLSGELMRRGDSLMRDLDEARGASDAFMVFRNHY